MLRPEPHNHLDVKRQKLFASQTSIQSVVNKYMSDRNIRSRYFHTSEKYGRKFHLRDLIHTSPQTGDTHIHGQHVCFCVAKRAPKTLHISTVAMVMVHQPHIHICSCSFSTKKNACMPIRTHPNFKRNEKFYAKTKWFVHLFSVLFVDISIP